MTQPDEFIAAMESTKQRIAAAVGGALGTVGRPSPRGASWRAVANALAVLLVLALVAPFVVHAVPMLIGAEHSYVVTSGSMEPAIGVGSVVMVNDVDPARIERGDVITFSRGEENQPTTHRVVEVVEGEDGNVAFRTKGDANEDPDQGIVTADQVEGRVMTVGGFLLVVPYMGYVVAFANTQTGYTAMVVVPIALLVLNEMYNLLFGSDDGESASGEVPDSAPTSGGEQWDQESAPSAEPTPTASEHASPGAGTATAPDAPADPAADDAGSETDAAFTLKPVELRLGAVVLAAFTAYSVWVATVQTEVWSAGIAAAVGVAFLLVSGLYLTGGDGSDEDPAVVGDQDPSDSDGPADSAGAKPHDSLEAAESQPDAERGGPPTEAARPQRGTPGVASQGPAGVGQQLERTGQTAGTGVETVSVSDDVVVRLIRPEAAIAGMAHQQVGSFARLVDMAASTGQPIYQDPEWETHYLVGKEILYVHEVYSDEDARSPSTAEDSRAATATTGEEDDIELGEAFDGNAAPIADHAPDRQGSTGAGQEVGDDG